ncbi:MAG: hypothetical protein R3E53_21200 [Myxococcota bacterium]
MKYILHDWDGAARAILLCRDAVMDDCALSSHQSRVIAGLSAPIGTNKLMT